MPTFEYEAMNNEGKVIKDTIQARNTDDAVTKIRDLNLFPTRVKQQAESKKSTARAEAGEKRVKKKPFTIGGVSSKQLTTFTRQLATLTDAGIPVVQSLDILHEQMKPCALKYIVASVADDVEAGSSLSEGMANYPKAFDNLYVNMIRAGETGGVLDQVLLRLAEFREKAASLRRQIIGAMIYPLCVVLFATAIVAVIIIYVIPQFRNMFTELGMEEFPLPTEILLAVSSWLENYWYLVPAIPIGLFAIYKFIRITKTGQLVFDWLKFKLPLIGPVSNKGAIARFSRTFGTLIGSGVPILEALNISRQTAGNVVLSNAIAKARDSIREGDPLAQPLSESKVCDAMVVNMIDVGEETGNLDQMLLKIADTYDEEVDAAVERLTSAMEPIMVVTLGVIVGFIVISLLLPLISLMSNLSGGG